jgi:acetyl-CoA carboxylase biotin carboxyl carrier protein
MANMKVEAIVSGKVWKIEKQAGEPVEAGEAIMILESMKMEIPIEAPASGRVESVSVAEGDSVTEGQVIAVVAG